MNDQIVDRIPVIDIDAHIAEPEDLWISRVSRKWGERIPHVVKARETKATHRRLFGSSQVQLDPEDDIWLVDERPGMPTTLFAWAGHDEPWPAHVHSLDAAHPASHDARARLAYMDETGLQAQCIFPNLAGSAVYFGMARREPELAIECCRAYNDFLTEWCSVDPKRLIPQVVLPIWDVDLCVAEVERCTASGHRSVVMTHQPDAYGLPWLADPHWNPLWAFCQEAELPICFHVEGARELPVWPDYPPTPGLVKQCVMGFLDNTDAISEVILSGICHRHPRLKIVSVESGAGYLPYLMETLDWQWINAGMRKSHPEMDLLPSEYFRRQIYGSFWFERRSGLREALELYPDNLFYETDFPHPTSISPGAFEFSETARSNLERKFASLDVPEEVLRKVLHDNAARVYRLE
jgi:uncharacterized protein